MYACMMQNTAYRKTSWLVGSAELTSYPLTFHPAEIMVVFALLVNCVCGFSTSL